ncbi:MAG: SGNH/GDSL hydrolase family protein, partial [Verrucomicrobiota bacterium]|nr:SGNH/GDSL hydrolase family protein [Verrucomicrobiota bacterium]
MDRTYGFFRFCAMALVFLMASGSVPAGAEGFPTGSQKSVRPFGAGDRVAFVGDSITAWGAYCYVVSAFYQSRFPDREIPFFYHGFGGYTAAAWVRKVDEILACKPSVAAIMLGMNDSSYAALWSLPEGEGKEQKKKKIVLSYRENMDELIAQLQAGGVERIILIIPTPFDNMDADAKAKVPEYPGKHELMRDVFGGYLRDKAEREGLDIIDLYEPMMRINEAEQKMDPTFSVNDMNDRIHPLDIGHFIMGYSFLQAQGLNGSVSEVTIAGDRGAVVRATNSSITELKKSGSGLEWSCLSRSLPYPKGVQGYRNWQRAKKNNASWALRVPFDRAFNQEVLRVTDLSEGTYTLKIDGIVVGDYSGKELA